MANQILVNHFPCGFYNGTGDLTVNGSIVLAGSAVSTGEPINWNNLMTGTGYNEINYRGDGQNGGGAAFTTGFAVSAGVCTVTANNNFQAGWQVVFLGNTQTLSALFNNQPPVTILSASSTQFTFSTAQTGTTTTGDVGLAVNYRPVQIPEPGINYTQNLTVTALSASGTTLTVTAANKLLPGAVVYVSVATGTLGPKLAGLALPVIQSTGTAFTATMPSALTGTTGTGTATGVNGVVPYSVKVWSELASGYTYQYNSTFGTLFVMQVPASSALTSAAPQSALAAAAYPAGVLADLIKFEARFARG
jgi:hypothetical protein